MAHNLRQSDRLSIFSSVAAKLRIDPAYVQRIAAGEVHAPEVDAAIKQEMDELITSLSAKRQRANDVAGDRRHSAAPPSGKS
jgi:hypothetical protein